MGQGEESSVSTPPLIAHLSFHLETAEHQNESLLNHPKKRTIHPRLGGRRDRGGETKGQEGESFLMTRSAAVGLLTHLLIYH